MTSTYPKVGVGVIVIKEVDGKQYIMLHQRKGEHAAGYWGSGGGHLELGESLQEGALRELSEEAGPDPLFPPVKIYLGALKTGQNFFDSSFAKNSTN